MSTNDASSPTSLASPTTPTSPCCLSTSPLSLSLFHNYPPTTTRILTSPTSLLMARSTRRSSGEVNTASLRRNSSVVSPLDLPSPYSDCLLPQLPPPRPGTRRGLARDNEDFEMQDAPAASILRPQTSNPHLANVISHLATPLVPLISVTTGLPHPSFPRSILAYNLLTHNQLDALSRHYHQTLPTSRNTYRYPCPVPGWANANADANETQAGEGVDLVTKRRRWGRFIGLRGCESPILSCRMGGDDGEEEGIVERMEREWEAMRQRREDDERLVEKGVRRMW